MGVLSIPIGSRHILPFMEQSNLYNSLCNNEVVLTGTWNSRRAVVEIDGFQIVLRGEFDPATGFGTLHDAVIRDADGNALRYTADAGSGAMSVADMLQEIADTIQADVLLPGASLPLAQFAPGTVMSVVGDSTVMLNMQETFMTGQFEVEDLSRKRGDVIMEDLSCIIDGDFNPLTGIGEMSGITVRQNGEIVAQASFSQPVAISFLGDGAGIDLASILKLDLTGTNGDDDMHGWNLGDVMLGRGGNDVMQGLGGDDTMGGGAGNDLMLGGAGDDSILGGRGNDLLIGGADDDRVVGGRGADILVGDLGLDTLTGGAGPDAFVFADTGAEAIISDFDPVEDFIVLVSGVESMTGGTVSVDDWSALGASIRAGAGIPLSDLFGNVTLGELTPAQLASVGLSLGTDAVGHSTLHYGETEITSWKVGFNDLVVTSIMVLDPGLEI